MVRLQLYTHVLFKYTTMATTHTRLCVDFDFDFDFGFGFGFGGINGTVSCWLYLDKQFVRWYECILKFIGVITWYNRMRYMARSQLHTHHVLFQFTPMTTTHTRLLDGFRFWWNTWNGIVFALNEQEVRWY